MTQDENASNSRRRRSLFDFLNGDTESETLLLFPEKEKSQQDYPVEYTDKVRTEIAEWSSKLTEALEKNEQHRKAVKAESKTKVYTEENLSEEHQEFLRSVSFDGYLETVQDYCNRMIIMDRLNQTDNELKTLIHELQAMIENAVFKKHLDHPT
ncbi:hypothetical protein JTB14_001771 [Gonioctena quinquepunctata]|nr:hypothetical protein JTB14_001771 [Gonioctena quinquepunctata]